MTENKVYLKREYFLENILYIVRFRPENILLIFLAAKVLMYVRSLVKLVSVQTQK